MTLRTNFTPINCVPCYGRLFRGIIFNDFERKKKDVDATAYLRIGRYAPVCIL